MAVVELQSYRAVRSWRLLVAGIVDPYLLRLTELHLQTGLDREAARLRRLGKPRSDEPDLTPS